MAPTRLPPAPYKRPMPARGACSSSGSSAAGHRGLHLIGDHTDDAVLSGLRAAQRHVSGDREVLRVRDITEYVDS
ncbi:hypothetical protein E2562_012972 [Oryza meyeriana var. granulata]|uniref:Uncharacterized protein n=1 Tax=Oryza meyeriana var. granulata TaxID=110450 RepID=A0A6G1DI49_9ORYZ|nr:hypothetical protein E2562_012972 [Oryza meyeriana var. granulata]